MSRLEEAIKEKYHDLLKEQRSSVRDEDESIEQPHGADEEVLSDEEDERKQNVKDDQDYMSVDAMVSFWSSYFILV